jgi:hypothetical protein
MDRIAFYHQQWRIASIPRRTGAALTGYWYAGATIIGHGSICADFQLEPCRVGQHQIGNSPFFREIEFLEKPFIHNGVMIISKRRNDEGFVILTGAPLSVC